MGLEVGTYISELVPTNPPSGDQKKQGDDHLRLLKTVLVNTFPNAAKAFRFPLYTNLTSSTALASTDQNRQLGVDASGGTVVVTLPTLTSGDDGWSCFIQKTDSSLNQVRITPPAGTINGVANVPIKRQYHGFFVYWSGSVYRVITAPEMATDIPFDATISGLAATELQGAIDALYTYVVAQLLLKTNKTKVITTITGSYTLVLGDADGFIRANVAGAHNITIPPNASVAFPIGTQTDGMQYGAGQTTFVPGAGVTIRSEDGKLKTFKQYSAWSVVKIAADEWLLTGSIAA